MHREGIRLVVRADRGRYGRADPVTVSLEATNTSAATVVLQFTSGQRYDFVIRNDAGAKVWRWSDGRGFLQALGSEPLHAGESFSFAETLPAPLRSGRYTVTGMVTARNLPLEARASFIVE